MASSLGNEASMTSTCKNTLNVAVNLVLKLLKFLYKKVKHPTGNGMYYKFKLRNNQGVSKIHYYPEMLHIQTQTCP